MATNDKDTIYIDIDDEITGIIDKLNASSGKVVALVLPKRATTFQSIVNMKLLKRAADESKKHMVLITSEAGLMPLAGLAGVYVAKTLNSKPEVPLSPIGDPDAEDEIDEDGEITDISPETDGDRSVGELAAANAAATKPPIDNGVETLELDDDELPEDAAAAAKKPAKGAAAAAAGAKGKKSKKDKKLRVPNFQRFRLLLILGGLIFILLIIGIIFALTALPKAKITIKTDATNVPLSLDLNLSTTATALKTSNNTIPAKAAQQQKTYTQQVSTTGQKNNGTKATGSVTVTNCGDDTSLPAGTGFSSGGNTYISQEATALPSSNFNSHGQCKSDSKASVSVAAQSPGASYNLPSGAKFSIAGGSADLSAQGNTISGGTDNIVQIVNQNDITNAKSKINASDDSVKQALQNQLKGENYFAILATYTTGTPSVTNSANVGDVASSVSVTETVTYMMFGVQKSDLQDLVNDNIKNEIDTSKQTVLDDGTSSATFNVSNSSATSAAVTMSATATAGPDLDVATIQKQAAGKRSGDIKSQLKSNPDVTDVDVQLSPFWVSKVPKKTEKITVTIAKPTKTASTSNGSNP